MPVPVLKPEFYNSFLYITKLTKRIGSTLPERNPASWALQHLTNGTFHQNNNQMNLWSPGMDFFSIGTHTLLKIGEVH